ncbi:MAG: mechanosensitive ion channel [Candidatus Electryonea clarkiae]|nr:mechanosensitive ion channel [Candidatus Electryonea clarkiae]MDP8289180.1 mechanosensitive ion channel [Candidatus Electryonea clarkiae]
MKESLQNIDLQLMYNKAFELAAIYIPNLFFTLIVLFVGIFVIRILNRIVHKAMTIKNLDESLEKFVASLISISLKIILLITVASMLGIQMTSFVALLGAAGLAVGLALQGSLSNFAGGILILLFKPFKVGDFIEAQGQLGVVKEIQIFNTILTTVDNKVIFIPNSDLSNGQIINYSAEATRRVDFTFGIGYNDDLEKARNIIFGLIKDDSRIQQDPEPVVMLAELADSSVNLAVRVWCKTEDYWAIFFDMNENVKLAFDKEGISIPFPQRDVHLYQHSLDSGKV